MPEIEMRHLLDPLDRALQQMAVQHPVEIGDAAARHAPWAPVRMIAPSRKTKERNS